MKDKNIIAIPPFYMGTSFQDIVNGMSLAVREGTDDIKIIGDITPLENIISGELLDDKNYVDGQLLLLKSLIQEGPVSKILFLDFFNPGMDLLKYYHEQQGIVCEYGSLLHGGSFLDCDLYSFNWMKQFESGWFKLYNKIYAPSQLLAKAVPDLFRGKISVYPWGLDDTGIGLNVSSKNIDVVFPHRLNADKGIEDFIKIVSQMNELEFVVTSPQKETVIKHNKYYKELIRYKNVRFILGQSGEQHIKTLASAKIVLSCARQENFGYGIMKAVLNGCIPVLPNRLCYPEFFENMFLYGDLDEAVDKIRLFVKSPNEVKKLLVSSRKQISGFSFSGILEDFFKN
ncbi:MAG: glycosyltransferase [Desulfitobacteriaceae bacterium]|nr:glycosyltransferase [Desulfitobacteriaceae bacterium]